jgi:hypothetical protein
MELRIYVRDVRGWHLQTDTRSMQVEADRAIWKGAPLARPATIPRARELRKRGQKETLIIFTHIKTRFCVESHPKRDFAHDVVFSRETSNLTGKTLHGPPGWSMFTKSTRMAVVGMNAP